MPRTKRDLSMPDFENGPPKFPEAEDRFKTISLNCLNIAKCQYRGTMASYNDGRYKQAGVEYVSLRCPRCFAHQGRLKVNEIYIGMTELDIHTTLRDIR